jgi:mannose-1-phosphate guanylyltransferase/phosphomannomutase
MNAVIMAGGFGTRMRPLTASLPKPMVPVAGKPLMQHVVELLARHGLVRQVPLLFYQPHIISDYFGDGSRFGVEMRYRRAEADFGTAGSVKNAEDMLDDRFIVISGDVLTDVDLTEALAFHERMGALATMVLVRVPNPTEFGVVICNDAGRVERFLEKPVWGDVISDTVNTGIYILEKEIFGDIAPREFVDFSANLFPELLKRGAPLCGYVSDRYWRDIGNPDAYQAVHADIWSGRIMLNLPGQHTDHASAELWLGHAAEVSPNTELAGIVIVGDHARVEDGASIVDSVIGADSHIHAGAQLLKSVLWNRVHVGSGALLRRTVICKESTIGDGCQISEQSVISERVQLGDHVHVRPNVRIWPGKVVESGATLSDSLVWGDRFHRELFTDAKISGIFNREFTPEFAVRLGGAWGAQLGPGTTVAASRDDSPASRILIRSLQSGLCAAGVNVDHLSEIPVPVVRHQLAFGLHAGGFHIRRNSESPDYVDLFVFDARGRDMGTGEAKSIERLFNREDFYRAEIDQTGRIEYPMRVVDAYRAAFLGAMDEEALKRRAFRIVIDYQRGSGHILGGILSELGIDTTTIDAGRQPDFDRVSAVVRSIAADLGVIMHPHAEKFQLIDEHGSLLDPVEMQRVIAYLYLSQHSGTTLASPVIGSAVLEELAERFGAKVVRVGNDHQAMMEAHADGADLVIGTRGGVIAKSLGPGADGLFGSVYVLALLGQSDMSLSEVRREVEGYHHRTATAHCPWEKRGLVMRRLHEWTRDRNADYLDGVRVVEEEGWIWFGPDPFAAQFIVIAESRSPEFVDQRLLAATAMIADWQSG